MEVFTIAVKSLDNGGKYDVYLEPGSAQTGKNLDSKINRKPIKTAHGTVRLVFNRDTLALNQYERYTVALVPRAGNAAGSRAAVRFTSDKVIGASRPQENSGDACHCRRQIDGAK